ncbi:MAG: ABC transporter ATP-binding protein, partial [Mangrovibacterium sp.]
LDWKLKLTQIILMAVGFWATFVYAETFLVKLAAVILIVTLIPGAVWFILNSLKNANAQLIPEEEEVHISIQNLVKIYDRPGRFSREWFAGLKIRQRAGLEKNFHSLKEFDHLIWQLPLLGFLIYFAFFYLQTGFWAYLMVFATWLLVREFARPFILLWQYKQAQGKQKRYARAITITQKFTYWFVPVIELAFIVRQGGSIGAFIGFGVIWYLGLLIAYTSNKLDAQNVNINRITGRFGGLRRATYRTVQSIPVIGKKRKPFRALNGVSLEIKTGMYGLLGPNGAGKSTMMRIICGIFEQSYGKIFINGIDTQEQREELQGLIGYLPQEFGTYESMSAWNYLNYIALLKGLKNPELREERLEYVLKAVHMWDKKDVAIGSFSGGMKQRIGIAQILLHLPRILVVDEPTAGLDPRERIRFRNLLVELSRERIVIFSTHIIEDIASSCNQVGVVIRGQVKYTGSPTDMVHLAQDLVWQYDITPEEFEQLEDKKMVLHHMYIGNMIRLRYLSKEQPHPTAIKVTPILEDAYLCLIKDL